MPPNPKVPQDNKLKAVLEKKGVRLVRLCDKYNEQFPLDPVSYNTFCRYTMFDGKGCETPYQDRATRIADTLKTMTNFKGTWRKLFPSAKPAEMQRRKS